MRKIKSVFSKIAAFLYVVYKSRRTIVPNIRNGQILLIEAGHIGDALLGAQAINEISKHFLSMNKEVYLFCGTAVQQVLQTILRDLKIRYINMDLIFDCNKNAERKISNIKKILESFKNQEFELAAVVSGGSPWNTYVAACVRAREKWGVPYYSGKSGLYGKILKYRSRFCFTKIITAPPELFMGARARLLAEEIGVPKYKLKIMAIPRQYEEVQLTPKYITVALDSAAADRRWPKERFARLIKWLLQEYPNYDIYLLGTCVPSDARSFYHEKFSGNSRVRDTIGMLNIGEWIELLRESQFHIGVDSGSIHVAAAVGTLSFCLTGYWDTRFFPYQIDEMAENTVEPVCIRASQINPYTLQCYGCVYNFGGRGKGNPECRTRVLSNSPLVCLERLEVEDVIRRIKETMEGDKLCG